jgi:uncharacterized protein DUF4003
MQDPDRFYLSEKPLDRFCTVVQALREKSSIWDGYTSLRSAALALTTMRGRPQTLVSEMRRTADALKTTSGWTSPLRSSIRFMVASALMRNGSNAESFLREVDRVIPMFREAKLPRGRAYEMLAVLILLDQATQQGWQRVRREQIRRLALVFQQMKADHPWLTGADDFACAALLAQSVDSPQRIGRRVEEFYQGLHQLRFSRGNALQTVSHLLYIHPGDDQMVMRRFRDLYHGFKTHKLWMFEGDYDEIACLTFLEHRSSEIIDLVLRHRSHISDLRPRIGRNESFSLACHTAFLELAVGIKDPAQVAQIALMIQAQAIIQAQQAATVAATSGGAAAAGAS